MKVHVLAFAAAVSLAALAAPARADGPASAASAPPKGSAAPAASGAPSQGASPNAQLLLETIGTSKDGFVPKLFSAFKRDMTPDAAGKLIPGLESPSKYGFAKVPFEGKPGVERVDAYFRDMDEGKPKLFSLRIQFAKDLATPEFYQELVRACEAKYGKAKPADVKKELVTWANRKLATAQISKDPISGAYMVNVTLPRP